MSPDPKARSNRLASLISKAPEAAAPAPAPVPERDPTPAAAAKKTRRKASAAPPRTLGMKPGRDHAMSTIVWREDVEDLEVKLIHLGRKLGSRRRIAVSALIAGLLSLASKDEDLMRKAAELVLGEED